MYVQHLSLNTSRREKIEINENMVFQENTCFVTEYVVMHGIATLFNQTKAWKEAMPINQSCDEMKCNDKM